METQLLSVQYLGYKRHSRHYANYYRSSRRHYTVDTLARDFFRELVLLEHDITTWFSRLTQAKEERILRYRDKNGVLKYQEIDFISESENGLKFCELKLKSVYKDEMSEKSCGIKQLKTTIQVAVPRYHLNGSLAICVDMSSVYEIENDKLGKNYCSLKDLENEFEQNSGNKLIWLNFEDITECAFTEGWLTEERITDLQEAYRMMKNPMEYIPEINSIPLNKPFCDLKHQLLVS
ncbi:hypothetical protein [Photobacterium damselae]|uniref:hypothetical protein n=1 Tax=Photobacterium damselae TaxID=38293 RepID=UPI001075F973|nr:hypothetical protein [Photobacterium damselae]MBE8127750.1 hypothetical protein [Photobacterium damselae subsp. piscicida]TLS88319.1 hypothetical protein FD720_05680 [Photobacterium damselae subsp. damselae]WIH22012.1 hypothetical protein KQY33_20265 [Photobacterium damselae]